MDTSKLKSFAQGARAALLKQISIKLQQVLASDSIARREAPDAVDALEAEIASSSDEQVLEKVAYTWFNRFCALRFMDANGYNRIAVVSPLPEQFQPEILAEAKMGLIDDSLGTDPVRQRIHDLLAGKIQSHDAQSEAYRLLLVAACNSWHSPMPFMFEKIEDYTELLMPADLLSDASILSDMRAAMTDEVCENVECIGWLYQFYISDKKDQVIGKVVKSEDIPAATQLFTPNWIVKYMVQNSLGAQWMATYPDSKLKGEMEYYIEPAEQTDEVNIQLADITPTSLNPEELTLIDPASGSGHILVEAYDLFKAIYLERGYQLKDAVKLILEKNLYGLDIDERAAQLTGFALMMKGRADDRRLFNREVKLNVMALQNSTEFDAEGLASSIDLAPYNLKALDLRELKDIFEHATTFGSLIQVPVELAEKLPSLKKISDTSNQDLFVSEAIKRLGPLVQQAELLADQYDAVVANPPYMSSKGMNALMKSFAKAQFPNAKNDIFSCFIERAWSLAKDNGYSAMVTMQSWMFLSSFQEMREYMLSKKTLRAMAQIGYNSFPSLNSKVAQATVFSIVNCKIENFVGTFCDLNSAPQSANKKQVFLERAPDNQFLVSPDEFSKLPGSPVAFWLSAATRNVFARFKQIYDCSISEGQNITADNSTYLRFHWEVQSSKVEVAGKWSFYAKGGAFRKWYGNLEHVIDWSETAIAHYRSDSSARIIPDYLRFREGVTWTLVTSAARSFRYLPSSATFDKGGSSIFFPEQRDLKISLSFLNTPVVSHLLEAFNASLNLQVDDVRKLPLTPADIPVDEPRYQQILEKSRIDWDAYERSWDFQSLPILIASTVISPTLESSYTAWIAHNCETIAEMKSLEEENNRLFIDAYGLADELTADVPIEQITLTVNPAYRYGIKNTEEERDVRFRQDTMEELISYAIGCMMGRYSLDADGLIMANSGETLSYYVARVGVKKKEKGESGDYTIEDCSFAPDEDAIIPILEGNWFTDDIVERMKEFLKVTFGTENYEENLRYLEDGLYPSNLEGKKRKGIREYFLKDFYAKHIQTYKKRPIYWLFSSPKGSFNALVYLHRYKADTVSVVLNDYLREFKEKLSAKLDNLQHLETNADASKKDIANALKEIAKIKKILTELNDWERDVLFPLAQQQIDLDLDDGVKVNYNKFQTDKGLALKKVTGLTGK